jgi:hypothetical protein
MGRPEKKIYRASSTTAAAEAAATDAETPTGMVATAAAENPADAGAAADAAVESPADAVEPTSKAFRFLLQQVGVKQGFRAVLLR